MLTCRGVVFIRPPRRSELHPFDDAAETTEPPSDDTLLSGTLEVIMKERRRCHSISVGVQSVSRLHMGEHGWEEDGIFERGVEVLGGDAEGIWLEKGSQSFTFSILLPATLAAHDRHEFGRISYILKATVEGIPSTTGVLSFWKGKNDAGGIASDIPFKEDFEKVIARSDKLAQDARADSRGSFSPPQGLSPQLAAMSLGGSPSPQDESAIAFGEASPSLSGLYHRRLSSDIQRIPSIALPNSRVADDNGSIYSFQSAGTADGPYRTEKTGWLKGDLHASRSLIVHVNPNPVDGVTQLDIRKEGRVDGLGPWRFTASSDVVSQDDSAGTRRRLTLSSRYLALCSSRSRYPPPIQALRSSSPVSS